MRTYFLSSVDQALKGIDSHMKTQQTEASLLRAGVGGKDFLSHLAIFPVSFE